MYCSGNGNSAITNCTFKFGQSNGNSGGIYCSNNNPNITDCTFFNNNGAVYCYGSSPTVTNCEFEFNLGIGAGMYCTESSNPTMTGCILSNNDSSVNSYNASVPTLIDTTICESGSIVGPWIDGGGNTISGECSPSTGSCCTNDTCVVSAQIDCLFYSGQWLGEGTTCEDNPCPTACLGDVTGDGQVDVTDILVVISVWGACP
jgi:parallel beta-helix repeat protein